jgi:hypothetical protein
LNGYFGIHSLDHDDGSSAFVDVGNVVAFAGMKNFLGFNKSTQANLFVRPDFAGAAFHPPSPPNRIPMPHAYYFPYCARSLGQANWGPALEDTFTNNTCILNTSGSVYAFGTCNPSAPGKAGNVPAAGNNTFYTSSGNASFKCGNDTLTLAQAQAVGYEIGSTDRESLALSVVDVAAMIRTQLLF